MKMRRLDSKETWGSDRLEAELEAARDGLRGLDRDIRKILGRDLPEGENGPLQPPTRSGLKHPLQEERKRNTDYSNNDHPGGKRRWQQGPTSEPKTVFSRLSARVPSNPDDSGDEDDNGNRPAVSSRVIATPREVPSRQEVIRRESVDERSRQRNKRMFGALLGTLQKFRQEETKLKAKEDKKAEVEARVDEAKRREKEELRRERQQLFQSRKKQLAEVKALETKLARSKQFQEWKASQLPLANFIRTQTQPAIYYLPKRKHPRTDALLEECAKELREEVERREKVLLKEIEIMESQVSAKKPQEVDETSEEIPAIDIPLLMEEGEENRDPNPEINTEETVVIGSLPKHEIIEEKMDVSIDGNNASMEIENVLVVNQSLEIENHDEQFV